MFVKLAVLACVAASAMGAWNGPLAGGQPAALYPAGVDPHACPNYPNCANPAVAVAQTHAAPQWNAQPQQQWNAQPQQQWNAQPQPQWNAQPQPQWNAGHNNQGQWNNNAVDDGQYTGDGDYRGEGLAESGAYGAHPSWNNSPAPQAAPQAQWNAQPQNNAAWAAAPGNNNPLWAVQGAQHSAPAAHSAPVPAGVDPHSCPNYPYCS